jgi:hypothetical protein
MKKMGATAVAGKTIHRGDYPPGCEIRALNGRRFRAEAGEAVARHRTRTHGCENTLEFRARILKILK